MTHAYEMAVDALGLAITSYKERKKDIPRPSRPDVINVEVDSFLVVIKLDMETYKNAPT